MGDVPFNTKCRQCADIYKKYGYFGSDTAVIISNGVIINSIDSSGYYYLWAKVSAIQCLVNVSHRP